MLKGGAFTEDKYFSSGGFFNFTGQRVERFPLEQAVRLGEIARR